MNAIQGNPTITPSATNKAERFVIYHRVSTARQGASGLGLEAQSEAVALFLATRSHEVIASYVEIESGKKSDRPELLKALAECRKHKATLLIAKLDRLARNVHFISGLMEAGVDFLAVDNPHATKLMVHLLAAFAEHEREMISKRTRDALQAAKARGVVLGANGKRLAEQNKAEARLRDQHHHPIICSLMREFRSYTAVAEQMNAMAIMTPSGGKWYASSVRNVCMRAL
ncbi:MAG: recombinase family protein [Alphaproteobacteria bacterium]|nr:recombinase family protein [Alphaproteobacteria bacterium]